MNQRDILYCRVAFSDLEIHCILFSISILKLHKTSFICEDKTSFLREIFLNEALPIGVIQNHKARHIYYIISFKNYMKELYK